MKHSISHSPFALARLGALSALLALSFAQSALAQIEPNLNDINARNTDGRVATDLKGYQAQQNVLKALNDTGKYPVSSYAMAKAQCWLDVSFHEYTRNDRSPFAQQALDESVKLTQAMKAGASNPAATSALAQLAGQTPIINNADKVRPDLWARAQKAKDTKGYGGFNQCAERLVACAEVELVHAGNESKQQGWRHSRPYIQIAEMNLNQAAVSIEQCSPTPPAPPVQREVVVERIVDKVVERFVDVPVAKAAPVPPLANLLPVQGIAMDATVLFNYNTRDMGNVRGYTKERLDAFIAKYKAANAASSGNAYKGQAIQVIGHADRTNGTGIADYNTVIAKDRAEAVKRYIASQGITQDIVTSITKGDSQQVEACNAKFKSKTELQECLLPNRRVEIVVNGVANDGK